MKIIENFFIDSVLLVFSVATIGCIGLFLSEIFFKKNK